MKLSAMLVGLGSSVCICACTGLTQMQDTAAKFDLGVHTASNAELGLFNQVQAAECARNFYTQGFDFATAVPDKNTGQYRLSDSILDLRPSACVHQELTDPELRMRQKLLEAITLYADAIQSLTNGTSETGLGKNATDLAGDIKTLATQQKFTTEAQGDAAVLNTAVTTIAAMIIDHSSYKHVKDAALAMQKPLSIVVARLKTENSDDAVGLESKTDSLANEMRSALSAARDKFGPASFLDVVAARASFQSLIVAAPNVQTLNDTLDAIVRANDALGRSTDGGAIPEIADLISRAQQASTLFNSSK